MPGRGQSTLFPRKRIQIKKSRLVFISRAGGRARCLKALRRARVPFNYIYLVRPYPPPVTSICRNSDGESLPGDSSRWKKRVLNTPCFFEIPGVLIEITRVMKAFIILYLYTMLAAFTFFLLFEKVYLASVVSVTSGHRF